MNFKQQIHHQIDVLFQGLFAVHISNQQIMRIMFPPPSFLHGLAFVKTDIYFRFPYQKQLLKSPWSHVLQSKIRSITENEARSSTTHRACCSRAAPIWLHPITRLNHRNYRCSLLRVHWFMRRYMHAWRTYFYCLVH